MTLLRLHALLCILKTITQNKASQTDKDEGELTHFACEMGRVVSILCCALGRPAVVEACNSLQTSGSSLVLENREEDLGLDIV